MRRLWILLPVVIWGFVLTPCTGLRAEDSTDEELQILKEQLAAFQKRIEVLEAERGKEKATNEKANAVVAGIKRLKIGAQIRPQYEGRDSGFGLFGSGKFDRGDERGSYTTMRSRLNVQGNVTDDVDFLIQFQDVRVWGQEWDTLNDDDADHQDLHQAYVDISTNEERDFYGFFLHRKALLGGGLSFYALWDQMVREHGDENLERLTLGSRWTGKQGPFDWRLEFYWQGGDWGDRAGREDAVQGVDIDAYMLGAQVGYTFPWKMKPKAVLWYDFLSGDDDPFDSKHQVFDTLYATNHKFYGYMDQFLNIPAHTDPQGRGEGLGLQDFASKISLQPAKNLLVAADIHHFRTAEEDPKTRTGSRLAVDDRIGEELDITAKYRLTPKVILQVGYSHFWAGEMIEDLRRMGRVGDDSDEDWFYSFVNLGF